MSDRRTIRIFISSPSDVRPERLKAEQIVRRLNSEFTYHFPVEAVLWERQPLVATHHFQDERNITPPRRTDIVVVILWARLGLLLPTDRFPGALSGRPVTGTEWEFEDALAGARENGVPDLLVYRKTAGVTAELDNDAALEELRSQRALVQDFIGRWFHSGDGQSRTAASHSFGTVSEFEEKLYDHLRELLERRAGASIEGVEIRWHEAPFRGLLSFEYRHAPVFFGRTRARNELRELLARQEARGCAFVLVLGASGSGKSSLVKAALLPDLMLHGMIGRVALVRWGLLRPSDAPTDLVGALAAALSADTALPELAERHSQPELAALLREAPASAVTPIREGLAQAGQTARPPLAEHAEARVTVIVDQLEELFTLDGVDPAERDAFVVALDALARSGLVWVIATMRSDYYDRIETLPSLAHLAAVEACYRLLPPVDAELGQIIRRPAREAGLRFAVDTRAGVSLDDVILQAAAKDRGALPLLSFLLDQLWQRRTEHGELTFAAYEELGGLEGAIGHRAEDVFLDQPEAVQKELVPVLRALVTVEGSSATARAAPLSLFPAGSSSRALVDALINPGTRLLVTDGDVSAARLRLAHEALLTHWPRAHDQVAADARDLELRGRLEQAAEGWRAAPRREKTGRVAVGLILAEARDLVARWGVELPGEVREFIAASVSAARRRRFRLAGIVAGAVVALPVIASLVWAGMVWRGVRTVEAEIAFVAIPGGCFDMGSPDSDMERDPDEGPVHRVCLNAFDLGEFAVTQGQWRKVMVFINPNPSYWKGDALPVESVNWNEARLFTRLMSLFGRRQYRLPSEAEYEYAARAGTKTKRYWGDSMDDVCKYENIADLSLKKNTVVHLDINPYDIYANCDDGYPHTAPVGSYKPNPFGLYDILGNTTSWVEDCYVEDYRDVPNDGSAVTKPDCARRVLRGGSYGYIPEHVRTTNRGKLPPLNRRPGYGLRLVRVVAP